MWTFGIYLVPEQDFARPTIPPSARKKATKKDIMSITNEQVIYSIYPFCEIAIYKHKFFYIYNIYI